MKFQCLLLACLGLLPSARAVAANTVDASQYDAFWLWSGVLPQAVLAQARSVYVLQGQIESPHGDSNESHVRFLAQGVAVPRTRHVDIWLVYRVHTLHWTPRAYSILFAQLQRWRQAGNSVVGVQVDFDAHTLHLQEYVDFLAHLRQLLPQDYRLGITGLLDWSSRADPREVNQLRGIVDEVVVQTYQGRHTIENCAAYLPRVSQLNLPFKIGLLQNGVWEAPSYLSKSPWFRGYVVFLQNLRRT
jgi:hypothetical protein